MLQCPQKRLAENDYFISAMPKLRGKLEQQVIEKASEQLDEHCDYPAKSDNRLSTAD